MILLAEPACCITAHPSEDAAQLFSHAGHLRGPLLISLLLVKWSGLTLPYKAMFPPPHTPSPPVNTGLIRKIRLQILVGDVDYLQIFPHIPPERHWRKVCNAPDLPMITEAAVPLKITRLGGGLGVGKVMGVCAVFHVYSASKIQRCIVHSLDYDADK